VVDLVSEWMIFTLESDRLYLYKSDSNPLVECFNIDIPIQSFWKLDNSQDNGGQ
jgi:hypothetical protein